MRTVMRQKDRRSAAPQTTDVLLPLKIKSGVGPVPSVVARSNTRRSAQARLGGACHCPGRPSGSVKVPVFARWGYARSGSNRRDPRPSERQHRRWAPLVRTRVPASRRGRWSQLLLLRQGGGDEETKSVNVKGIHVGIPGAPRVIAGAKSPIATTRTHISLKRESRNKTLESGGMTKIAKSGRLRHLLMSAMGLSDVASRIFRTSCVALCSCSSDDVHSGGRSAGKRRAPSTIPIPTSLQQRAVPPPPPQQNKPFPSVARIEGSAAHAASNVPAPPDPQTRHPEEREAAADATPNRVAATTVRIRGCIVSAQNRRAPPDDQTTDGLPPAAPTHAALGVGPIREREPAPLAAGPGNAYRSGVHAQALNVEKGWVELPLAAPVAQTGVAGVGEGEGRLHPYDRTESPRSGGRDSTRSTRTAPGAGPFTGGNRGRCAARTLGVKSKHHAAIWCPRAGAQCQKGRNRGWRAACTFGLVHVRYWVSRRGGLRVGPRKYESPPAPPRQVDPSGHCARPVRSGAGESEAMIWAGRVASARSRLRYARNRKNDDARLPNDPPPLAARSARVGTGYSYRGRERRQRRMSGRVRLCDALTAQHRKTKKRAQT
ncbi:hypothetical protein C8J57DRAFT_1212219 [Mycena rebaudengoi]|nr:hypothetical protein C8J57DRAFT_1212219 [Mycena rebaudengoi]